MAEYTRSGVIGRPSLAAAEKGKAVLASLVDNFASVLEVLQRGEAAGVPLQEHGILHTPEAACPAR